MSQLYRLSSRFFATRPLTAAAVAVLLALAATALRVVLTPAFGDNVPFILLFPSILAVAALAGPMAGTVTLVVGAAATWLLVIAPPGGPFAITGDHLALFAALASSGGFMIWIAAELRDAVARATIAKARLDAALDASGTGTWYWSVAEDRLEWDDALAGVYRLPASAVPKRAAEFVALVLPEDRPAVEAAVSAAVSSGGDLEHEFRIRRSDGEIRWIYDKARVLRDDDGAPVAVLGACRDVTQRIAAEASLKEFAVTLEARVAEEVAAREATQVALAQAQRLEAIGQLTGGVAHDFNNLLQALSGCLQMIRRRVPDTTVHSFIEAGQQAVERGGRLTQQLMAFARRQALRPEPTDVRNQVLGMAELLARALRADIDLSIDLAPDLWPVEVDPTQFEVAILNLAVNARDAMPDGGQLTIAGRNFPHPEGDCVELSVSDTGEGIPPDLIERVFEPFFTTKEVGKGSGLGLSQVHGFAGQSGGSVHIDSTPGTGTTVTIRLPRSHGVPQHRAAVPAAALGSSGGRILVVEDDPVVGTVVATMLRDFGYEVVRSVTADDALATLERGEAVDLVFSDVVMPGRLSGVDLAKTVLERWPDLPVLLTTGYNENVAVLPGVRVLSKPYQINLLLDAVDEELRARSPTGPVRVPPAATV